MSKLLNKSLIVAAIALSVPATFASLPAHAEQSGLVNVDLSNVRTEIAKDINVDVSQIPVTVQAPIGVAANVCNVAANVLATAGQAQGGCAAKNTSTALNQIAQRQITKQK